MKFIHIADLHLGKRYNEIPLNKDQEHILSEILKIADEEKPDGVLIAGDVYDKSVPSAEAVETFDGFLNALSERKLNAFIISGNHDSAERLAFGSRLMKPSGIYISPVYCGNISPVTLRDEYGEVNVYMLPFVKPAHVRRYFEDEKIESYTEAVACAIREMNVDETARNVLVAHQFVTGSQSGGSEDIIVGDTGNVDGSVFKVFDYVALGHIHRAQSVGAENIRYSGAPLKYSLSEAVGDKSVTVVELNEKGKLSISLRKLTPLRDVAEIKGTYAQLTQRSFYQGTTLANDFVHVTLTDETEIPDALGKLRLIYPNLASIKYDNARTRSQGEELGAATPEKSPFEMFSDLFSQQNNRPMSEEQIRTVSEEIERLWGEK